MPGLVMGVEGWDRVRNGGPNPQAAKNGTKVMFLETKSTMNHIQTVPSRQKHIKKDNKTGQNALELSIGSKA